MELALRKDVGLNKVLDKSVLAFFFIIGISLGAFVRIPLPFTPVPLTLQTFFVLLCAACLGMRWSLFVQSVYLFLGIAGLPVFAGANSGLWYLLGPTAGYLLGFVLAAVFISLLSKYSRDCFALTLGLFLLADVLLLLCGALWLKVSLQINLMHSLLIGFFPFLAGDALKAFFAAFLFWKIRSRISSIL